MIDKAVEFIPVEGVDRRHRTWRVDSKAKDAGKSSKQSEVLKLGRAPSVEEDSRKR